MPCCNKFFGTHPTSQHLRFILNMHLQSKTFVLLVFKLERIALNGDRKSRLRALLQNKL